MSRIYTVELPEEAWPILMRPVNGQGGAQGLLRKLQACANTGHQLLVEKAVLDTTYRYAYRYAGNGGFQRRFRVVVRAALIAGWQPASRVVVKATRSRQKRVHAA